MKFLNARAYIAMGLAALTASLVLIASVLEIFPDRDSAVRDGRAALAETLAASTTRLIANRDVARRIDVVGIRRDPISRVIECPQREPLVVTMLIHQARFVKQEALDSLLKVTHLLQAVQALRSHSRMLARSRSIGIFPSSNRFRTSVSTSSCA